MDLQVIETEDINGVEYIIDPFPAKLRRNNIEGFPARTLKVNKNKLNSFVLYASDKILDIFIKNFPDHVVSKIIYDLYIECRRYCGSIGYISIIIMNICTGFYYICKYTHKEITKEKYLKILSAIYEIKYEYTKKDPIFEREIFSFFCLNTPIYINSSDFDVQKHFEQTIKKEYTEFIIGERGFCYPDTSKYTYISDLKAIDASLRYYHHIVYTIEEFCFNFFPKYKKNIIIEHAVDVLQLFSDRDIVNVAKIRKCDYIFRKLISLVAKYGFPVSCLDVKPSRYSLYKEGIINLNELIGGKDV